MTLLEVGEESQLVSTQEEVDTKIILHCQALALQSPSSSVIIRSHSGDTDIIILAISLLQDYKDRIIFDDGNGKNRRQVKMSDIDLDTEVINALIGFLSFTGNDYCSSFFRKGKPTCFKVLLRKSKFQNAFARLGDTWELPQEIINDLELYLCAL